VPDWATYLRDDGDDEAERLRLQPRTGRPLGSDGFVKRLEAKLGHSLLPRNPGRKRKVSQTGV